MHEASSTDRPEPGFDQVQEPADPILVGDVAWAAMVTYAATITECADRLGPGETSPKLLQQIARLEAIGHCLHIAAAATRVPPECWPELRGAWEALAYANESLGRVRRIIGGSEPTAIVSIPNVLVLDAENRPQTRRHAAPGRWRRRVSGI